MSAFGSSSRLLFYRPILPTCNTPEPERTCESEHNGRMKDKRIIRMPKRHVIPPPGYFLAQIGDQIYCFDIEGNEKPPAKVLSLVRRKKAGRRASPK